MTLRQVELDENQKRGFGKDRGTVAVGTVSPGDKVSLLLGYPMREQCFAEFVKAIPALTVSESEKQRLKIEAQEKEISEMQTTKELNKDLGVRVKKLERALLRDKFLDN